jgi:hypothetical protein
MTNSHAPLPKWGPEPTRYKAVRINGVVAIDRHFHYDALDKLLRCLGMAEFPRKYTAEFGYFYPYNEHRFYFTEEFNVTP